MPIKRHEPIPKDYEVQPLKPGQKAKAKATCGACGLSWDDGKITSMTPTPAARCPFEAFHIAEESPVSTPELNEGVLFSGIKFGKKNPLVTPLDREENGGSSNVERAQSAHESLKVFARQTMGPQFKHEDLDTILSDFLADAMHLCRMTGTDFDDCIRRASNNFDIETSGAEH